MSALTWRDYPTGGEHTAVGTIKISTGIHSPQLGNQRELLVYLPRSYATSARRYPVLYMQDGLNLFDEATSYSGEWQVDETMEALGAEGVEAIVVGIPNAVESRGAEYSFYAHPQFGGGRADAYLEFVADTVKPAIDGAFRTLADRANTGIMGSSLGGLISLYAFLTSPETFGFAGVMSPALWWTEGAIFPIVEQAQVPSGRLYMDVGDNETPEVPGRPEAYLNDATRMAELLRSKGFRENQLRFVVEPGGPHHEAAWARRLPDALRFLLPRGGA